jgi:phage minor structural protein
MVNIYEYNETDFNHRGTPLKNFLKCEITEALNGVYELNFEYPLESDDSHLLENGKILKVDNYDGKQLFRIIQLQKELDIIKGYALHITYDLLGNFIEDIFIQGMNGARALHEVLTRSTDPHNFIGTSDIQYLRNSRLVRKNTLEAIMGDKDNSLLSRWGGELYRDNFRINWLNKIGNDKGVSIKYAKNLTGFEYKVDLSGLVTHFIPKGFDGLLLPEKYVISPLADKYKPIVKRKVLELEDVISKKVSPTQENAVDHEQALALLKEKANKAFENGADKPEITCTVSFVDLSQTKEYKRFKTLEKVYLGDTVEVSYKGIKVKTRCVGYSYDCLQDRYLNLQLGNTPEPNLLANAINQQKALIERVEQIERGNVEKAKEAIKASLNEGLGSNIKYYKDRILIMDTDSEETARVVWKFNSNGLSVSTSGVNGEFKMATTKDGMFFAEIITGLKINSEMIETGAIDFKHLSSTVFSKVREGLITKEGLSEFLVTNEGLRQKMNQIISEEFEAKKPELKGDSSYIHKKYSNNANGTPMTDDVNSKYMGLYTGSAKTPPVNASDYNWIKIKFEERLVKGYANSKTGLDFTTVEPFEESTLVAKNRPRVQITNNNDISDIWQANDEIFLKPDRYYYISIRAKGNTNELHAYIKDYNNNSLILENLTFGNELQIKSTTFVTPKNMSDNNVWLKFAMQPEDANWEGVEVDWWTIQEYGGHDNFRDFPLNTPAQYHKFRYFGYANITDGKPTADKFEWFDLQQKSMQTDKYTHLVYSDNPDGTDFGKEPKKYMGIARTTSPVTPTNKEEFKWFKITGEDGKNGEDGHSLNAYLRLEGSYLNSNIANFGAYVKVMYDGVQISNFDISHSYRGASFPETSNQASAVYSNGLITNMVLNANKTDGTPLYVDITVKYKGLTSVASARLDNTVDVELVNSTIKKFKTFESTLDTFESTLKKNEKDKFKMAYNVENLCSETNLEKKGNDLYFQTKKPLEANKTYYILAWVRNAPDNFQKTAIYNTANHQILVNGLNVWETTYKEKQTQVNFYPLGNTEVKVSNVRIYEKTETPFPTENVLASFENNDISYFNLRFKRKIKPNEILKLTFNVKGKPTMNYSYYCENAVLSVRPLVEGKNTCIFSVKEETDLIQFSYRGNGISGQKSDFKCEKIEFDRGYKTEYNITEVENSFKQIDDKMSLTVKKNDVISSINLTPEAVKIDSKRVDVTGLLTAYTGAIGGFLIGKNPNDKENWWLTGQNQFRVGMSNGGGQWKQTALWVNWGYEWGKPSDEAWFVKENGEMYCYNQATFSGGLHTYNERIDVHGQDVQGDASGSSKTTVIWWSQISRLRSAISDKRLKENIQPTKVNALDTLNKIEMVEFNWKKDGKFEKLGAIAQQVKSVEDSLVVNDMDDKQTFNDHLRINYYDTIPYLIKAVQELSDQVNTLTKRVEELERSSKNGI